VLETGSYHTGVAMWSGNLAPDNSDFAALSFPRASVDECDTLAKIESVGCVNPVLFSRFQVLLFGYLMTERIPGGLGILDTFDLEEGSVRVCVALAALIAKVLAPVSGNHVSLCVSVQPGPFQQSKTALLVCGFGRRCLT